MAHGAGFRATDAVRARGRLPNVLDPGHFPGFCHLLGEPRSDQRSKWHENVEATRALFGRLAQALPAVTQWTEPLRYGADPGDNPFIPSGYTYLLQFIAHDVVQTTTPFWAAVDLGVDSANHRAPALMLSTLYGGGPAACPMAFEPPPGTGGQNEDEDRARLRLGRLAGNPHGNDVCPVRDLARVNIKNIIVDPGANGDSVNFDKAHVVQVADGRNDDNLILTQLTVLFALAHNVIADNVNSVRPEARFSYSRAVMLAIYHKIIRCDLLPRLLHPEVLRVLQQREEASKDWLWHGSSMPLEFSHGAYRIGHAMVRRTYNLSNAQPCADIKSVITHNQRFTGGVRTPLDKDWVLQWSRFFEISSVPNYSRRLSAAQSFLDVQDLFPAPGASPPDGVTVRDLLSAAAARLWSVDALISTISMRVPNLIPWGWSLAHPSVRQSKIEQWLRSMASDHHDEGRELLSSDDVRLLSSDPPLPLFILLETQLDPDPNLRGRCMGVLGSIIVGEVLCRILAAERRRVDALLAVAQASLSPAVSEAIDRVDSMPLLVDFVAQFAGLGACGDIPFI